LRGIAVADFCATFRTNANALVHERFLLKQNIVRYPEFSLQIKMDYRLIVHFYLAEREGFAPFRFRFTITPVRKTLDSRAF